MLNSIPKDRQESILRSVQSGRFASFRRNANTIYGYPQKALVISMETCIDINDGSVSKIKHSKSGL
jgi:hypothetical protein